MSENGAIHSSRGAGSGIHVVADIEQARAILGDTGSFRIASMSEFVPNLSNSFFLAADMSDSEGAERCHAEMAAYLAPNRLPKIYAALRASADEVVTKLRNGKPFDLERDCLIPYGHRTAAILSGLPWGELNTLIAAIKVAADASEDGDKQRSSSLLGWAWNRLHVYIADGGRFAEPGLPAFAQQRKKVSSREIALLTMPLIEMAAYRRNTAIARIALTEVRRRNIGLSEMVATGSLMDLLWWASAFIEDLRVTRVARKETVIAGQPVGAGDRVIVNVTEANKAAVPNMYVHGKSSSHIAFGWGIHACIARGISLQINQAIVESLTAQGELIFPGDASNMVIIAGNPGAATGE